MHDWQKVSREQLGMAIAAMSKVVQKGAVWLVPSQSSARRYTVCPDQSNPHCTCPDHEETGERCKHIFAVEYVIRREYHVDGTTTVTEQLTVETQSPRKTYQQNWHAYNAAQVYEKEDFLPLLFDLCQLVESEPQQMGRPRLPIPDMMFAAVFKVFSTFSTRRFMSDLRAAHALGYISKLPCYNSICNYLEDPALSPVLRALIIRSSYPLKEIETHVAVDSTGFTASRFTRWYDLRRGKGGKPLKEHTWVKAHIICGVNTNIITDAIILGRDAADTKQLPELLATTAWQFNFKEVSADRAYSSVANHEWIALYGADALIPFKSNATGQRGGQYRKAFLYYANYREEFLKRYHKRENAEATMSMIKAKFRDNIRSKTETAMKNEVLCKILCHNICVLIQSKYDLTIEADFSVW